MRGGPSCLKNRLRDCPNSFRARFKRLNPSTFSLLRGWSLLSVNSWSGSSNCSLMNVKAGSGVRGYIGASKRMVPSRPLSQFMSPFLSLDTFLDSEIAKREGGRTIGRRGKCIWLKWRKIACTGDPDSRAQSC